MRFTIFQESRIGKRRINQDRMNYSFTRDALMLAVADGMGGHPHGEVAAQIAVQTITDAFVAAARTTIPDPYQFLSRTLNQAHLAINEHAIRNRMPEAPRTTCIVCVIQDNAAHWAHVGDSRLYAIRAGRLLVQTRDHSQVQLMLEQGLIDPADAVDHPARNRVYSCLGGAQLPEIEFSRRTPLKPGDLIALCSDGAWAPFSDDTVVRTLAAASPVNTVPRLLDLAEEAAGKTCDNLTLIAMQWEEGSAVSPSPADDEVEEEAPPSSQSEQDAEQE